MVVSFYKYTIHIHTCLLIDESEWFVEIVVAVKWPHIKYVTLAVIVYELKHVLTSYSVVNISQTDVVWVFIDIRLFTNERQA